MRRAIPAFSFSLAAGVASGSATAPVSAEPVPGVADRRARGVPGARKAAGLPGA